MLLLPKMVKMQLIHTSLMHTTFVYAVIDGKFCGSRVDDSTIGASHTWLMLVIAKHSVGNIWSQQHANAAVAEPLRRHQSDRWGRPVRPVARRFRR
jgi:hypothetical protein